MHHLAVLDGVRASFLLSRESDEDTSAAADWAWSSDVRHHILLKQQQIIVTRVSGTKETFERQSVESKLIDFLNYLEVDSDAQKIVGAIDHLLRLFRRHRAALRQFNTKQPPDLQSFLYLLAIAETTDAIAAHHDSETLIKDYSLTGWDPQLLNDHYVSRFVEEVLLSSTSMRRLLTPLTVRHAGGALFQEAQAEILSDPIQMTLFGLANAAPPALGFSLPFLARAREGRADRQQSNPHSGPRATRDQSDPLAPAGRRCGNFVFAIVRFWWRPSSPARVHLIARISRARVRRVPTRRAPPADRPAQSAWAAVGRRRHLVLAEFVWGRTLALGRIAANESIMRRRRAQRVSGTGSSPNTRH
jgi:hypothetical protein